MELFCAWARSSAGHQAEEFIVQKPVQSPPPSLPTMLPPLPPPPLPQRMYDKQQVRKPNDVILVCQKCVVLKTLKIQQQQQLGKYFCCSHEQLLTVLAQKLIDQGVNHLGTLTLDLKLILLYQTRVCPEKKKNLEGKSCLPV